MNTIAQVLLSAVGVSIAAWILPGISVKNFGTSIIVAIVLALLNAIVKPFLDFISIPINLLTLGLFSWVINTVIILLCAFFVKSFHVKNFGWGLLFSIVLSILMSLLESIF